MKIPDRKSFLSTSSILRISFAYLCLLTLFPPTTIACIVINDNFSDCLADHGPQLIKLTIQPVSAKAPALSPAAGLLINNLKASPKFSIKVNKSVSPRGFDNDHVNF